MQYVLILVAGGILLASTFIGWKKGFLKMTLSMLALIIALVVTWMFSPTVTDVLRNATPLYSITKEAVAEALRENLDSAEAQTQEEQEQILEESFLPSYIIEVLKENNKESVYKTLEANDFLDYVSSYVAGIVVNVCGVVITFILASLLLHIVILLLSVVDLIPGLHAVNKLGGGFLGFVQGLILIWFLCFVITLLAPTELGQEMLKAIEENVFLSMIYNGVLSFSSVLKMGLVLL